MKAIIIDDEANSRELLTSLATKYTPQVDIIAQFDNGIEALTHIEHLNPDILFLDIEMPNMNGFEFLSQCTYTDFYLVFTTAYNEYAIQAIKNHAFDYLLKPIRRLEFIDTVHRIEQEKISNQEKRISDLLNHIKQDNDPQKIILTTHEGMHFIDISDILYVKGEGAYSKYHCRNGSNYLISKPLKDAESKLLESSFKRVHASFLINFNYVSKYVKSDGGYFVMSNGDSIPVSRTKKHELLNYMNKWI